jgi:MFS family permease
MPDYAIWIIAATVFGIAVGAFASWLESRFGKTEGRYAIQGIVSIGGIILIFLFQLHKHQSLFLVGYYAFALLISNRLIHFKQKQP